MRRQTLVWTACGAVAWLALVACGSTPPAQSGGCPSGTVLRGGDCVPPESGSDEHSTAASEAHQEELVSQPTSGGSSGGSSSGSDTSGSSAGSSGASSGSSSGSSGSGGSSGAKVAYDKDATEIILNRAARQVKANCGSATDEDGKANGPWGKTRISVTLGRNGHSKTVTVPSPFEGKPSGRCAVQAFSNLTFPPYAAPADVTVDWDVEIVQPGK